MSRAGTALSRWHAAAVGLLLAVLLVLPLGGSTQCGVKVKPADRAAYEAAIKETNHRRGAQQMRQVAQRNPKAADPQFQLGLMAVRDGFNTAGIRRYFGRCIDLCPKYPHPLAHYYMALVHYTDARYDEAVAELEAYFAMANGSTEREVMKVYEEASNYLYWSRFLAEAEVNTVPFEPRRLVGVSSKYDEMLPYISVDGREAYYLRRLPVKQEYAIYEREMQPYTWQLCVSQRLTDSTFSPGKPLPAPFNSGRPEGSVSLTADGRELYYSAITTVRGYANSDIYLVRRDAQGRWQKAEALGKQVNGEGTWESQPSVSADGRELYFASNRPGGHGGTDIWRCHRLPNGDWSRAECLGNNVNTAGNDKCPFLAADGHTLYFLSDGWQGFGGYDIYIANLSDPNGNRPTNLGLPINSEDDELSFGVSTDGSRAYFGGRTEASRSSDVLVFDLYPAARPDPMVLRRVRLVAEGTEADTMLILPRREAKAVCLSLGNSLPYVAATEGNRWTDSLVRLNDTLMPLHVGMLPGSRLSHDGELAADALAQWLLQRPMVRIAIECPRSTDARAIADALRQRNIRPDRVSYRGGTDIERQQIRLTR